MLAEIVTQFQSLHSIKQLSGLSCETWSHSARPMVPEFENQRPGQFENSCGSLNHAVDGLAAGARGSSRILKFWKLLIQAPEADCIAFCYIYATHLADARCITSSQLAELLPVKVHDHEHRFCSRFGDSICPNLVLGVLISFKFTYLRWSKICLR